MYSIGNKLSEYIIICLINLKLEISPHNLRFSSILPPAGEVKGLSMAADLVNDNTPSPMVWWTASDEDGNLYAEAEALGAYLNILASKYV